MPEGFAVLVRATFFRDNREETDEERLAACTGSTESCLSNVLGVFRFPDEKGDMARHVAYRDRINDECNALSARIEGSKLPRPYLRSRYWWKLKELESIRSKEVQLAISQMGVSDVFEEKNGKLCPLTYNEAHRGRLDELYMATDVKIVMFSGRLMEPALDYVA